MRHDELLRLAENIRAELLPRFPELAGIKFNINYRLRRALGRAALGRGYVELSGFMYVNRPHNDHLAQNTIRHELAHMVAYGRNGDRGHGTVWKAYARSMGCTGDRCTEGVKFGDEMQISCHSCGLKTECSEKKMRKWDSEGRRPKCPRCANGMPFPWNTGNPSRNLVQRG